MRLGRKSRQIGFTRTLASRMGLLADIRLPYTFSAPVLHGRTAAQPLLVMSPYLFGLSRHAHTPC